MKKNSQIVIVDLGCQYTQLIARVLLSLKINSLVLGKPGDIRKYLKENTPKGIILSGSNFSVYADNAPEIPEEIFSAGCPILGICYGMQYIAYREDNSLVVSTHSNKEYGPATVFFDQPSSPLFAGINDGKYLKAWESHGD